MSMAQPDIRIILDVRNSVGESIIWSPREQALYWVDIVGCAIHRLDPQSGMHEQWPTPELPTSIGLRRDGGFVVGLRQRIALWSPGGAFTTLAVPEPDRPGNRLNEGVVAPDGSFWVGTMQDNIGPDGEPQSAPDSTGYLYRITPDGTVSRLSDQAFGITNTMIWTDDDSFVTADTIRNTLFQFRYDKAAHRLTDGQTLPLAIERGLPDGSARDAGGTIYNCRVAGGAALAAINPDRANASYIDLPCLSPTSCTFGGPDLSTLYITSARFGMSDEQLASRPSEGAVLAIDDLPVSGLPANLFGP